MTHFQFWRSQSYLRKG